jgi:hypothetical protein
MGQTASGSHVLASILPGELRTWNRQHLVPMTLLPVSAAQSPEVQPAAVPLPESFGHGTDSIWFPRPCFDSARGASHMEQTASGSHDVATRFCCAEPRGSACSRSSETRCPCPVGQLPCDSLSLVCCARSLPCCRTCVGFWVLVPLAMRARI